MLLRHLRLLLRISTTSAINGNLTRKGMSVLSGPPARRISLITRMLHLGIMGTAYIAGPVIFFTNLKKIKGIKESVEEEDDDDEGESGAGQGTPPAESS